MGPILVRLLIALISGGILESMGWISSPEGWIALVTLTVLEIVLGIDNIVFISILSGCLPAPEQARARNFGLTLAMITRILLLLSLTWIMRLTTPLFAVFEREIRPRPNSSDRWCVSDRKSTTRFTSNSKANRRSNRRSAAPSAWEECCCRSP